MNTPDKRILYAGDTALTQAASYLAGVLSHAGFDFDYLASDEPLPERRDRVDYDLYILSDFPVKNVTSEQFGTIADRVRAGAGLLMIGGWESFHGAAGEYHDSPLVDVLPVTMADTDDRVNCPQPCLVEQAAEHEIVAGLPWERPPGVGGYNRLVAKGQAEVLLRVRTFAVEAAGGRMTFTPGAAAPLLVVGKFGSGRAAAFASDAAPHWVGGLVDWGDRRITACAPGSVEIEVGNHYAQLFANLVRWTLG